MSSGQSVGVNLRLFNGPAPNSASRACAPTTSGDPRVAQLMLQHASPKMTERYTLGAEDDRLRRVSGRLMPGFGWQFRLAVPDGDAKHPHKHWTRP